MSTATKVIFIMGILLLIYGYLCRLLSIYFFWDSKHFGWAGIVAGVIALLIDIRMARKAQRKNIFFIRLFAALIILASAIHVGSIVLLKNTNAYQEAITRIKDGQFKTELGDIKGFGIIPSGAGIVKILNPGNTGSIVFVITARGEKAYRDVEIKMEGGLQMQWLITSMRIVYI